LLQQIKASEAKSNRTAPGYFATAQDFLSAFVPMQTVGMVARTMSIVMLAVVSVVGGGAVSAAAYKDAVPGEALYGTKRMVEGVQLRVAPTLAAKTRLYTEFADTRIEEVSRLVERGEMDPDNLEEAIRGYGDALVGVKQGIGELESRSAEVTVDVAKIVERKLVVHQDALIRAKTLVPSLAAEIGAVRREAEAMSLTTMAYLVEKHLAGAGETTQEIVSLRFEQRIKTAEGEVETALAHGEVSEDVAAQAKTAIAQAKELVKQENYQAALLKMVEVADITEEKEVVVEEEVKEDGGETVEEVVEEEVEQSNSETVEEDVEEIPTETTETPTQTETQSEKEPTTQPEVVETP
jgi:hypothetical protein